MAANDTKTQQPISPREQAIRQLKVKGFLDAAREEGTIVAGGEVMERAGYFIRPKIGRAHV